MRPWMINRKNLAQFLEAFDQPKLIPRFKSRPPDQARPGQTNTTTGLTLFCAISQLKLIRIQPTLKLKLTSPRQLQVQTKNPTKSKAPNQSEKTKK